MAHLPVGFDVDNSRISSSSPASSSSSSAASRSPSRRRKSSNISKSSSSAVERKERKSHRKATASGIRRALDIPERKLRKCARQKGDTISKVLAHGVFLAVHDVLGCTTILRVRTAKHAERERSVLKFLGAQGWTGAPRVLGSWEHRDLQCLRIEYVEGIAANEHFFHDHRNPVDIVTFSRTLARLLRSLHAAGVVHLDVKPENIIVRPDGSLTLIDWEHARFCSQTEPLGVCGTVNYVAPEVLLGQTLVRPSLDVWSYGITVFLLATGSFPAAVRSGSFEHACLPSDFAALLEGALQVDAASRLSFDRICEMHFSLKCLEWSEDKLNSFRSHSPPSDSPVLTEVARSNSTEVRRTPTRADRSPVMSIRPATLLRIESPAVARSSTMPTFIGEQANQLGRSQSEDTFEQWKAKAPSGES